MKSVLLYAFVFVAFTGLISACTSDKNDPIQMDGTYVNQQIILRAPSYANEFGTNEALILELKYNSINEIVFPNNYGLRIFEETEDGWKEVQEKPTERTPTGDIIFSPEKLMPAVHIVGVYPNLQRPGQKHNLRVYVIGEMNVNGEVIKVAAYTDVTLKP